MICGQTKYLNTFWISTLLRIQIYFLQEGLPTLVRMAACAETNFRPDLTYQFVEQDEETMDSGIKTLLREEIEIQETINFSKWKFCHLVIKCFNK